MSPLIYFFHILLFSAHDYSPCMGMFVLNNFIFLVAVVNGDVFFISILDFFFSMCRNEENSVLTLYLLTSLNPLIRLSGFLVVSLAYLGILSYHLQTVTVLPLLFLFVSNFFFLFFSECCSRSPNSVLDKNGESGQFCLVQDLVVMISVLQHWESCLQWIYPYIAFIRLKSFPLFPISVQVLS